MKPMAGKPKSKRTLSLIREQKRLERSLKKNGKVELNDILIARSSGIHGTGVFARHDLKKGTTLIEYIGEKVGKREAERRSDEGKSVYLFELNKRVDIDGSIGGNGSHWINHSCDPNAESELDGNSMMIVTTRPIRKGEELSYDYQFDDEDYEEHICRCGAKDCRGYIINLKSWKKVLRKREREAKRNGKRKR